MTDDENGYTVEQERKEANIDVGSEADEKRLLKPS